ncbi:UNVERIFIED_CONTAM: hypothetical protein Slati_0248500 [Sesamum latifolium]|uniref:Uncharacterized protein n=1 Tax=Sesamum latifolium TaxID=2727402 RepID=A0AAW2YCY9_9LAMI
MVDGGGGRRATATMGVANEGQVPGTDAGQQRGKDFKGRGRVPENGCGLGRARVRKMGGGDGARVLGTAGRRQRGGGEGVVGGWGGRRRGGGAGEGGGGVGEGDGWRGQGGA